MPEKPGLQRHSPVHEWQLAIVDFKGITTKKREGDLHLCVVWMTLARQGAVLSIEPVLSSGVARPSLTNIALPPVRTVTAPILRITAAPVQALARLVAVSAVSSERAELMALKQRMECAGDVLLLPPTHLRSSVAWLTPAVAVERITVRAVVALAFLFTTSSVTAVGARVGTNEALENMGSKLLVSGSRSPNPLAP